MQAVLMLASVGTGAVVGDLGILYWHVLWGHSCGRAAFGAISRCDFGVFLLYLKPPSMTGACL